jgi:SAM-dependent methyltransferase
MPVLTDRQKLRFYDTLADQFDIVVATESIEHTIDPRRALAELHRVLRPGGTMIVTVPNQAWHFAVTLARTFRLRPHDGFENWLGWFELQRELGKLPAPIEKMFGFHIVPPLVRPTEGLIRAIDRFGRTLGPIMLNIAVRARKADAA